MIVDRKEQPSHLPDASSADQSSADPIGLLSDPITRFSSELLRDGIMAPVQLPGTQDLMVRLVDRSVLLRFEDARDDVAIHQGLFFIFLGGLLGLAAGAVGTAGNTGETIHPVEFAIGVVLVIVVASFGLLWRRSARRAEKLRVKIFADP